MAVLKTITAPDGAVTTFGSDTEQRTTSLTRGGQTWRFDYTTPWQTTVTDPLGNTTTHRFDRRGQLTSSTGPPHAPMGLRAVPGDGRAAISWNPSQSNGSPVSGYTLTASPGGARTNVAGDATSAMFEGLTNATAYTFTATATNAIGTSVSSLASNSVTPTADASLLSPLVAPSDVAASRGDTVATVTWTKPILTLPLLTTFDVTTYRASDGIELGTTSAGTDSSVTVTGLRNGTPVYFSVTARSLLIAAPSEPSNTITPAGPPFAPTGANAERGDGRLVLSWQPPESRPDGTPGDNGDPISSYTVSLFRGDDDAEVRTVQQAVNPLPVEDLDNGTTYYFKVRATNSIGTGPDSPSSNYVTPAGRPFAPTDIAAVALNTEARVRWTAANGNGSPITGYTVTASDGTQQNLPAEVTSTSFTNLQEGISYTFSVVATNDVGNSQPSVTSNPVAVTKIPGQPGSPTATAGVGDATVTWTPADPHGAPVLYYTITSIEGPTVTVRGDATSVIVPGLSPGSFHAFSIFATNRVGDGRTAVSNAVQIPDSPSSPFNVSAVAIQEGADIRWVAPPSGGSPITSYTVTASPGGAQITVPNDFGPNEAPSGRLQGVNPATTYTFSVVATNEAGDGVISEPSNAVRPLAEQDALRQQADRYMMGSLGGFLVAKGEAPLPFDWSDDGCSSPVPLPSGFHEPCLRHDFGYRNYGKGLMLSRNEATREWIDDILFVDWLGSCNGDSDCEIKASDAYLIVRACGENAFSNDGIPFCKP